MSVASPLVGLLLDERYRVEGHLADGGMASVYLATDQRLRRTVAIKIIHPQLVSGPRRDQFVRRFHSEALAAAAVDNPHIVQVYDTGEAEGLLYIVMEYVRGTNLRDLLHKKKTLVVREALRVLSGVLDGLAVAHKAGLVHRDVKPENVLINVRGRVQITDFGLVKSMEENDVESSTTGVLLGTASYVAPETAQTGEASPRSDLYAVGIMGYEMLTGTVPFASANPMTTIFRHVNQDVPSLTAVDPAFPTSLTRFLTHLTQRDPLARPANAQEALSELDALKTTLVPAQLDYRHAPTDADSGSAAPLLHSPAPPSVSRNTSVGDVFSARSNSTPLLSSAAPAASRSDLNSDATRIMAALTTVSDTDARTIMSHTPSGSGDANPRVDPALLDTYVTSSKTDRLIQRLGRKGVVIVSIIAVVTLVVGIVVLCTVLGVNKGSSPTGASASQSNITTNSLVANSGSSDALSRSSNKQSKMSPAPTNVTIPAGLLDCSNYPDAAQYLRNLGMTNVSVVEQYSGTVKTGCTITSSIKPGTDVPADINERIVVSRGPQPVIVPNVTGMSFTQAQQVLDSVKLEVITTKIYSDSVADGSVISTDPKAGSSVTQGKSVTLSVSQGPQYVTMPNLGGLNVNQALAKLRKLGLEATTKSSPVGEAFHRVLSQIPAPGTRIDRARCENRAVTLTII